MVDTTHLSYAHSLPRQKAAEQVPGPRTWVPGPLREAVSWKGAGGRALHLKSFF